MNIHGDPPKLTTEILSTLLIATSISRSTFRTLPVDVQMDYARFYDLPDAEILTTDEITSAIFRDTEWTPVLEIEGHIHIETAKGVIVAKEVMDLVDLLVEHPEDTHIGTQHGADGRNECFSREDHQRMEEDLRRANTRIKAAVEESRRAVRETCADIFILQSQLEGENAYQSAVTEMITNVVGVEVMQGIKEQLDEAEKEGCVGRGTRQGEQRKASTPYHVVTVPAGRMGLKRNRDDEDIAQNIKSPSRKRPRLIESSSTSTPSQNDNTVIPPTILNYSIDNEGTDDTYTDSNGTERDFVDDPYDHYDSRGRNPYEALPSTYCRHDSTSAEDSDTHTDDSENGVPWRRMVDFTDDSSDSEYQPPDLDLEDIWELKNTWESIMAMHPLFEFNFANEFRDCDGVMSDGDLSTDDPDEGYHDLGILQRPSARIAFQEFSFSESLGPHRYGLAYSPRSPGIDDETFARFRQQEVLQYRYAMWQLVNGRVLEGRFPPLDLEQRLAEVLKSDHTEFYFDNEEWTRFGELPVSIPRPRA